MVFSIITDDGTAGLPCVKKYNLSSTTQTYITTIHYSYPPDCMGGKGALPLSNPFNSVFRAKGYRKTINLFSHFHGLIPDTDYKYLKVLRNAMNTVRTAKRSNVIYTWHQCSKSCIIFILFLYNIQQLLVLVVFLYSSYLSVAWAHVLLCTLPINWQSPSEWCNFLNYVYNALLCKWNKHIYIYSRAGTDPAFTILISVHSNAQIPR